MITTKTTPPKQLVLDSNELEKSNLDTKHRRAKKKKKKKKKKKRKKEIKKVEFFHKIYLFFHFSPFSKLRHSVLVF